MPRHRRVEIVGLALLACLALLSLARRDLFVGDETKYAQVVREMHADGSVLVPTLNGEPYTHKPPLHFWLMYVFTWIGGQRTLWPYILPAVLSAVALVWMTGRIASRRLEPDLAWSSRFFLLGLAMVWALALLARMDLMFACFTTAGSVTLFDYVDRAERRDALMAGLWFGLAGLVKGPAAALILASLFVFESFALRRRPRALDLVVFVLCALVPLLWFVPAVLAAGTPYLEEIVMRQTAGRAVASWVHREPPWYYVVAAPALAFPWFFPLASAIRSARASQVPPAVARCMRWILAIVVPFSLISSKLPVYMVPALPPVAMLAAWYVHLPVEEKRWRNLTLWAHRITFALFAVVPVAVLSGTVPLKGDGVDLLNVGGIRAALLVMAMVAVVGLVTGWKSVWASCVAMPFVFALPAAVALTVGAPAINDFAASRLLVKELARQYRSGDRIAMYHTPHLWSRDMPEELESARQIDPADLERGALPALLAVRSDRVAKLGPVLDDSYDEVSSIDFMGKTFNVYRRR